MWLVVVVAGALVPLCGQLAALLVVRPSRIGAGRKIVWVPVVGVLVLSTRRAISCARRVVALAAAAAGSYAAVALLALAGLLVRGEVVSSRPVVKAIAPGAPAAGRLEVGDRIERANGDPLEPGGLSLPGHIRRSPERVSLEVVRGGEARTIDLTPARDETGAHRIGVELTYVELRERSGLARAAGQALVAPARRLREIARASWEIATGESDAVFMGPVGIQDPLATDRSSADRAFDLVLLLAIYGLLALLPLDLALAAIAIFTRDKVRA